METWKELRKAKGKLKRVFEAVRQLAGVGSVTPTTLVKLDGLRFSAELRSQNLSLINNQTVKKTNKNGWWTALLQPCLPRSKFKSCKLSFKVKKVTDSQLIFGVCQLTPNFKIADEGIHNAIQHGSFTYYNNYVFLGKSEGHRRESMNIMKYQTNNLVQVEYESETKRVTVRNRTQNTQSVTYIKIDNNLPLYVGVILGYKDDQVQIVGGECKQ